MEPEPAARGEGDDRRPGGAERSPLPARASAAERSTGLSRVRGGARVRARAAGQWRAAGPGRGRRGPKRHPAELRRGRGTRPGLAGEACRSCEGLERSPPAGPGDRIGPREAARGRRARGASAQPPGGAGRGVSLSRDRRAAEGRRPFPVGRASGTGAGRDGLRGNGRDVPRHRTPRHAGDRCRGPPELRRARGRSEGAARPARRIRGRARAPAEPVGVPVRLRRERERAVDRGRPPAWIVCREGPSLPIAPPDRRARLGIPRNRLPALYATLGRLVDEARRAGSAAGKTPGGESGSGSPAGGGRTSMSESNHLRRLTAQALARRAAVRAEVERRRDEPPQPGDIFLLAATAEQPVAWAVVEEELGGRRLLVVPADTHPLASAADVEVPPGAACGPLWLRCRHGVWLEAPVFDLRLRTGHLEQEYVQEARQRCRQLVGTDTEHEGDLDYADWERDVLLEAKKELASPVGTSPARTPPARGGAGGRPGILTRPYWAAAAAGLLVSVGFVGGMLWPPRVPVGPIAERPEPPSVARRSASAAADEPVPSEQELRRRLTDLQRQMELAEGRHRGEIAELERRLGNAPPEVLVGLPLVWLSPRQEVRSSANAFRIGPAEAHVLLILEVRDSDPESSYELEIRRRQDGALVWKGTHLRRTGAVELPLVLPGRLLPTGGYLLLLSRSGEPGGRPLAEYELTVESG